MPGKTITSLNEPDNAVEEVETTTEPESAPVETNTEEPTTPVDAIIEPEEPSKTVPYDRFAEVNAEKKQLQEQLAAIIDKTPVQPDPIPELEPDAERAIDAKTRRVYEELKIREFDARHAEEFTRDPLLKAALNVEFNEARAKGQYFDLETGLVSAKAKLDARVKPQVEAALNEGVKEGQDIARTKQQLGAVGEPAKVPEIDPDKMSAKELATFYKLPRIN